MDTIEALYGEVPKRKRILDTLIEEELTKAAVQVRTGLARSTVDRTINALETEGWITSRKVGGINLYRPDPRHRDTQRYLELLRLERDEDPARHPFL